MARLPESPGRSPRRILSQPMRVAVVIPCHNYGRYLAEAVASVAAQSRPADEIVIVDDASTDETPTVSAHLVARHPGIQILRHEFCVGPARAFNSGVDATSSDLVVILDADDRLGPGYLECMTAALKDGESDFAYCGEHLFGAVTAVRPVANFDVHELACENYINKSAMFRRELFLGVGGFREDFDDIGLEDWEFWVHAAELGATGRAVPTCWLEYRRHPEGSRNTMRRFSVLKAHLAVHRLHPTIVGLRDVYRWMARSATRNARSVVRRRQLMRPPT